MKTKCRTQIKCFNTDARNDKTEIAAFQLPLCLTGQTRMQASDDDSGIFSYRRSAHLQAGTDHLPEIVNQNRAVVE